MTWEELRLWCVWLSSLASWLSSATGRGWPPLTGGHQVELSSLVSSQVSQSQDVIPHWTLLHLLDMIIITGGLDTGGIAVYASHFGTPNGWAFWMCMACGPIFIANGLFTLVTVCRGEDTINRYDYSPEMMYETADKQPLMSSHFKDPPTVQYPNPMYDRGAVSPMQKQFPSEMPFVQPSGKFWVSSHFQRNPGRMNLAYSNCGWWPLLWSLLTQLKPKALIWSHSACPICLFS